MSSGSRRNSASTQRQDRDGETDDSGPASEPQVPQPRNIRTSAQSSSPPSRKPRILLAASGSVAAIKFSIIAESVSEWAEVKAVATKSALHFIDTSMLPIHIPLYTDDDEWKKWSKVGDTVLHIELRKWADIMVISPLSANTLAKLANGMCDNLLTCVVRAWDFDKPLLIAPAMNTHMWTSPFTNKHLDVLMHLGATVTQPISKTLACGDVGTGAMAEPATIEAAIRKAISGLDLRGGAVARLS